MLLALLAHPSVLFALANLKSDAKKLWAWATHPLTHLIIVALAGYIVIQRFELAHERKNAAAYLSQRDNYKRQLDAISSARNTQKQTTAEKIKVVTRTVHDADERAKVVEAAPAAPNCETKPEVLQADL